MTGLFGAKKPLGTGLSPAGSAFMSGSAIIVTIFHPSMRSSGLGCRGSSSKCSPRSLCSIASAALSLSQVKYIGCNNAAGVPQPQGIQPLSRHYLGSNFLRESCLARRLRNCMLVIFLRSLGRSLPPSSFWSIQGLLGKFGLSFVRMRVAVQAMTWSTPTVDSQSLLLAYCLLALEQCQLVSRRCLNQRYLLSVCIDWTGFKRPLKIKGRAAASFALIFLCGIGILLC